MADAVYSQQLARLKHGLPLWVPEPTRRDRAVAIGDVGYVKRGAFYPLFNACLSANDQTEMGVPEGFQQLALNDSDVCVMDKFFDAGPLYTASVTKIETCAEVSAAIVQAEAGIQFHCANKVGAVLVLKQPATRRDALPCRRLADYIRRHHSSWLEFANERHQRGIEPSDLVLVAGCDLTSEWALAAFTEAQRGASIFFRGGYSSLAGGGLSLAGTWDTVISAQHRSGPPQATSPRTSFLADIWPRKSGEAADMWGSVKMDQCVFLRGYKIRSRRLLAPKVIEAAAEPKDDERKDEEGSPPSSPILEGGDSDYEVESLSESALNYDPLDCLLEYILDASNAQCAIACHDDLALICPGLELPDNLPSYLQTLSPDVTVDEDGVGTLETRETNDFVHPKRDYSITAALPGSEAEPIPGCDSDSTPGCPEPLDTSPLFVRANHEYHPTDPSALSFNQNDVIEVLDQKESGWWDGLLGGERGWFPSNFVDVVLDMTEAASYGAEYAAAAASPPMPGKSVGATELDAKAKTTPPPSPGRQVSPKVAQGEPAAQDSAGSWWDGPMFYANPQARESANRVLKQARTNASGIFSRWSSTSPRGAFTGTHEPAPTSDVLKEPPDKDHSHA